MANLSPLIRSRHDVDTRLALLLAADSRLLPIAAQCGDVPLRILGEGFAGLTQIIVGQLLSVAAARAIHGRLVTHLGDVTPQSMQRATDEDLRALGLSFSKIKSLKAIARQLTTGQFSFDELNPHDGAAAVARLTALPGIGRWTAELYLISALGHPDIFPAGDLALRKIVGLVIGANHVPSEADVREAAQAWAPHRAVAARLLWRYFAVLRDREGINL